MESTEKASGSKKRKLVDLRRPLSETELEELANAESDECEYSEEDPFSSDDSIGDKTYNPSNDDSIDSSSNSSESNMDLDNKQSTKQMRSQINSPPHGNNSDEEWTDTEEDAEDGATFPFTPMESINVNIAKDANAIQYFQLFFDDSIVDIIVQETNRRGREIIGNQPVSTRKNKKTEWRDISIEEMKKFIGLCCLSGNVHFPTLGKQWSRHPLYYHPIFGQTMSRNRFTEILRMLRFVDHSIANTDDKLYKIRPILEKVVENIKAVYSPGQHLSIDEAMILWRGRLSFRQYIPNKRHKYGIKLYELTTDSGYILNIIVYVGKGTLADENESHATSVVKQLLDGYLGKGHILYVDNFYSSVSLAEHLFSENTGIVGTLRVNRKGNPKNMLNKKIKKGEAIWKRKGKVVERTKEMSE